MTLVHDPTGWSWTSWGRRGLWTGSGRTSGRPGRETQEWTESLPSLHVPRTSISLKSRIHTHDLPVEVPLTPDLRAPRSISFLVPLHSGPGPGPTTVLHPPTMTRPPVTLTTAFRTGLERDRTGVLSLGLRIPVLTHTTKEVGG